MDNLSFHRNIVSSKLHFIEFHFIELQFIENRFIEFQFIENCFIEYKISNSPVSNRAWGSSMLHDPGEHKPHEGASHLLVDGTFKVAPKLFCQLFTIGIILTRVFLPLIYFLLPDKASNTYSIVFKEMSQMGLSPTEIMCDFENAILCSAYSFLSSSPFCYNSPLIYILTHQCPIFFYSFSVFYPLFPYSLLHITFLAVCWDRGNDSGTMFFSLPMPNIHLFLLLSVPYSSHFLFFIFDSPVLLFYLS